jgi:hypothetical protein
MTGHLGYEKHDPAGRGSGNSRIETTPKTVLTDVGAVDLAAPVVPTRLAPAGFGQGRVAVPHRQVARAAGGAVFLGRGKELLRPA